MSAARAENASARIATNRAMPQAYDSDAGGQHQLEDLARRVQIADRHLAIQRLPVQLGDLGPRNPVLARRPEHGAGTVDQLFDFRVGLELFQNALRIHGVAEEDDVVTPGIVVGPALRDGLDHALVLGQALDDHFAAHAAIGFDGRFGEVFETARIRIGGLEDYVAAIDVGADVRKAASFER